MTPNANAKGALKTMYCKEVGVCMLCRLDQASMVACGI
jgi:hypothetical protein